MKTSPPNLENAVLNLQKNNFLASVTSFNPTGIKTDAKINEIIKIFQTIQ